MSMFTKPSRLAVAATAVVASSLIAGAQTYRGGIAGTVQDASGAVVAHAKVTLTNPDTGYVREMESTSGGDYSFQDLPIGNSYSISVTASGFGTVKIDKIAVRPGQVYGLDPKLAVNTASEQVEVNAAAIALDTESSTNNNVVNEKAVQNIPLNGRDYTQLIKITPGYNGAGSLNGARTNQNNYQIDGADSNDIWQNGAAANQGGVNGIAGVTIPVEAIDQFTVQSQGNAEAGRNAGGLISLAIKTGTNSFHGSAYYYTRNEFFAARSPFLPAAQRKPKLRNQQFGASIGGPIIKDRVFFFVNYERQKFVIQSTSTATEPVAAYVNLATALLARHNTAVNPLSYRVLSLYPLGNAPGYAATPNNYLEPMPQVGYSDNAIGNINWNLTPRQSLKAQVFVGTGRQTAPVGSYVFPYFEVAPDITQNFSLSHNWAITDRTSNQLIAAVGVFNQTFNDAVHNQNIPALGLNTGVTSPSLFGAPTINLGVFDQTGATTPLGRKDYTGHITDVATYILGKHQFRAGGEFRRNYMDLQYQRNVRGTFNFDGQATVAAGAGPAITLAGGTPWYNDTSVPSEVLPLADFMSGYFSSATFTSGNLRRNIYQNTFSGFLQDSFRIMPTFTLNYGLRYEYNAPINSDGTLSVFRPGASGADQYGLILAGNSGKPPIYNSDTTDFSPRVGFSYQPNAVMVIRANYGLYYDAPNFNGFFDNRPGNGAAVGVQANPTGATPVLNLTQRYMQWITGVNPFTGASTPATQGVASTNANFKTAYAQNYTFNTEYQVSRNTVMTLSYVGSKGSRLFNLSDINQARPTSTNPTLNTQARRPFFNNPAIAQRAILAAVNEIQSNGYSNYNSLQASIRTSSFHGLTAQAAYTWGHALDVISSTRGLAPQDSANLAGDYGNADFDVSNTFNAYAVYEAPQIGHRFALLTKGWQGNSFVTAFTGTPFSIKAGSDVSGTAEGQDRVNLTPGFATVKTTSGTGLIPATSGTASPYALLYNKAAFSLAPTGTFGTTSRNAFRGPGFFTVDASLVKNTQLREGVNLQLRAETFNIFNRINLSNPTSTYSSGSFGRSTSTRNSGGATGIGPGEPFNVQFAGKLIF